MAKGKSAQLPPTYLGLFASLVILSACYMLGIRITWGDQTKSCLELLRQTSLLRDAPSPYSQQAAVRAAEQQIERLPSQPSRELRRPPAPPPGPPFTPLLPPSPPPESHAQEVAPKTKEREPMEPGFEDEGCGRDDHPGSSRNGIPCLPAPKMWPWKRKTQWKMDFGDRAVRAVTPWLTEKECGSWLLYGDSTWCMRALDESQGKAQIALSYGIEQRDPWSEYMSNKFGHRTKLYDCFIPHWQSLPMAGEAPNATGPCPADTCCYETPYEPYSICLGCKKEAIGGKQYETLLEHLDPYPRLSIHLKIDTEGTEWTVLDQLMNSPEHWDKIRTFDMELHFGSRPESELEAVRQLSPRANFERQIRILERLLERFEVTGSTLEVYHEGWFPWKDCPYVGICEEPEVYTSKGFKIEAFAVSYVHKELVGVTIS